VTAPAQRATPTLTTGASATGLTFTDSDAGTPVADSIIVAIIYIESAASAVTPPAGWSTTFNGTTMQQTLTAETWKATAFWIRRGGSAPSYAFTWSAGSPYSQGGIASYDGAVTSGDPWSFGAETVRDTNAAATFPTVSGTTAGTDELLIWTGMNFQGIPGFTPPTGYTSRVASGDIAWADKAQAAAGAVSATGAVWTGGANGTASAMLMGLMSPGGGAVYVAPDAYVVGTGAAIQRSYSW
jgi:hypothetical protein